MPDDLLRHVRRTAASATGAIGVVGLVVWMLAAPAAAQEPPPALTQTVNDLAGVIDPGSEAQLDAMIRALQRASGDVVVVATVDTFQPYGDIREYAVEMFENRGRGIGEQGKDNGLLVLLAVEDRQVWVEVGYDLEQFITDGFAGETSRELMAPEFRRNDYGAGLVAGVGQIIGRVAERRGVTLEGAPQVREVRRRPRQTGSGFVFGLFMLFIVFNAIAGRTRRRRRGLGGWGMLPFLLWNSGVGPFGGGFGGGRRGGFGGGGFGGGGFGGGFGGFGGGRSGGGGGGASW